MFYLKKKGFINFTVIITLKWFKRGIFQRLKAGALSEWILVPAAGDSRGYAPAGSSGLFFGRANQPTYPSPNLKIY
jgi:hypothetical protein